MSPGISVGHPEVLLIHFALSRAVSLNASFKVVAICQPQDVKTPRSLPPDLPCFTRLNPRLENHFPVTFGRYWRDRGQIAFFEIAARLSRISDASAYLSSR